MVENEELGVITTLLNLKNSDSAKIKSAANGALWTLREDLENSEKYHELGMLYFLQVTSLLTFCCGFNP